MALRNQRGRLQSYDNITVGSQNTSQERTISGSLPPVELATTWWRDNLSVGNAPPTAVIADNIVPGTTTTTGENVKVGG